MLRYNGEGLGMGRKPDGQLANELMDRDESKLLLFFLSTTHR